LFAEKHRASRHKTPGPKRTGLKTGHYASTERGGKQNGNGNGGIGKECKDWTDEITDQWEMGGQHFGEDFPDGESFDGGSDHAGGGGGRGGRGQGGGGGARGV
jgi:hypothetical protein